jgi:hypothetical protein
MKRCVGAAVVVAGLLTSVASATELTIHPGVGIGKVRLGMSKAQVQRVLGRDSFVNAREGAYTEFAWDFASWTVGFKGGRAVQVSTSLRAQRTKKGIGPGTTWLQLMRAYPGGRCTWNGVFAADGAPRAWWPEYIVGHRGGTQTLYVFSGRISSSLPTVASVVVRSAFRPLPQFGATWPNRCGGDWRHAEKPELKFVNP